MSNFKNAQGAGWSLGEKCLSGLGKGSALKFSTRVRQRNQNRRLVGDDFKGMYLPQTSSYAKKNGTCVRVFISSFQQCIERGTSQSLFSRKWKIEVDQVRPTSTETKPWSFTLTKKPTSLSCDSLAGICQSAMRATRATTTITTSCLTAKRTITEKEATQSFGGRGESSSDGGHDDDDRFLGTFGQQLLTSLERNLVFWIPRWLNS